MKKHAATYLTFLLILLHKISLGQVDDKNSNPFLGMIYSVVTKDGVKTIVPTSYLNAPFIAGVIKGKDESSNNYPSTPTNATIQSSYQIPEIVKVAVSLENGKIKRGDLLGISNLEGVAAKLKDSGFTIGIALEDSNDNDKNKTYQLIECRVLIQYVR